MTYSESAKDVTIDLARAMQELKRHGIDSATDIALFFADMGDKKEYKAKAVLVWLGY